MLCLWTRSPNKIGLVLWRDHQCQLYVFTRALLAIKHCGFFSVPHLLWSGHPVFIPCFSFRTRDIHTAGERLTVERSSLQYLSTNKTERKWFVWDVFAKIKKNSYSISDYSVLNGHPWTSYIPNPKPSYMFPWPIKKPVVCVACLTSSAAAVLWFVLHSWLFVYIEHLYPHPLPTNSSLWSCS